MGKEKNDLGVLIFHEETTIWNFKTGVKASQSYKLDDFSSEV